MMEKEWLNMKIKIRRNVFETNSSSVHSFTFCTDSEFEQWKRGKLIFDGWENKLIPISDMKHDCDEARYYTYNHFLKAMLSSMKHSGITVQHHLEIKLLLLAIMDMIK